MTNIPAIDEQGSDTVLRTSELTTAQMCMRKLGYNRHYLKDQRPPPNEAMLGGLAVDDALTYHNTQRINGRPGLLTDDLVDYAISLFRERKDSARQEHGLIKDEGKDDYEYMIGAVIPLYM